MSSTTMDCEILQDFEDSGCIQDESVYKSGMDDAEVGFLDLPDDVLRYILKYCSPRDLKALGFSCPRLARLVCERSLWRNVDARSHPCSQARFRWLLEHALDTDTKVLKLSGFAKETVGCLGFLNFSRKEIEEDTEETANQNDNSADPINDENIKNPEPSNEAMGPRPISRVRLHHGRSQLPLQVTSSMSRSRYGGCSWPDTDEGRTSEGSTCTGPQFTVSKPLLNQLCISCPNLTELALEYCNIDWNTTNVALFPKTLLKLSLRGSRCFNLQIEIHFLFKIQDHLNLLQFIDVSECDWMSPATLLPISKLPNLEELVMRDCPKMTEYVAYASLTARYGFKALKSLDLRGSPVGDSEVSALGWLPKLEKLWLQAASRTKPPRHYHCCDDEVVTHQQLDDWEKDEPFYFSSKWSEDDEESSELDDSATEEKEAEPEKEKAVVAVEVCSQIARDYYNHFVNTRRRQLYYGNDNDGEMTPAKRLKLNLQWNLCFQRHRDNCNANKLVSEDEEVSNSAEESPENANLSEISCEDSDLNVSNDNTESGECSCSKGEQKSGENNNETQENDKYGDDYAITAGPSRDTDQYSNIWNLKAENGESSNNKQNSQENDTRDINEENGDYLVIAGPSRESQSNTHTNLCNFNTENGECSNNTQKIPDGESCNKSEREDHIVIAGPSREIPNNIKKSSGYVRFRQNCEPEFIDSDEIPKADDKSNDRNASDDESDSSDKTQSKEQYVHFRKNRDPIYVNCAPEQQEERPQDPPSIQYRIEPRHHVLYVNIGAQLNSYRFPRNIVRDLTLNFQPAHIDASSLVTDFALRRFGNSNEEDVHVINIGPYYADNDGFRPTQSNLRFLSVTGYRNITDRSLVHLATSAPNLTYINFSETNVSDRGAENFRSLRPDCELIYSKFKQEKED